MACVRSSKYSSRKEFPLPDPIARTIRLGKASFACCQSAELNKARRNRHIHHFKARIVKRRHFVCLPSSFDATKRQALSFVGKRLSEPSAAGIRFVRSMMVAASLATLAWQRNCTRVSPVKKVSCATLLVTRLRARLAVFYLTISQT